LKEWIKRILPGPIRRVVQRVYHALRDGWDRLRGRRGPLHAPRHLTVKIGIENLSYDKAGAEFHRYFVDFCGLKPEQKVLEMGCGPGRMAIALVDYLKTPGGYEGLDIDAESIDWCRKNLTRRYPHFRFQWADVFNSRYNPKGTKKPEEYAFPYESESFDLVFLTSVFTHMLPEATERYLREVTRVLKKDGRCLITWLILNDESRALLAEGKSKSSFAKDYGHYAVEIPENPDKLVGYDEKFLRELYARCGLTILPPIRYGRWCARPEPLSYQDIVVAFKKS